jgi:hypothetical protein
MKPFLSLLVLLVSCFVADAGSVKKSLVGKWKAESGEGALKQVTALEFRENGDFYRQVTIGGQEYKPILGGKWRLTTDATGVKAVFADPNKLILTYKEVEPLKMADKTEAWLVTISKDPTFDGKETLRLGPLDGSPLGTNYYFRVP